MGPMIREYSQEAGLAIEFLGGWIGFDGEDC
jgi:hypothetical protein